MIALKTIQPGVRTNQRFYYNRGVNQLRVQTACCVIAFPLSTNAATLSDSPGRMRLGTNTDTKKTNCSPRRTK